MITYVRTHKVPTLIGVVILAIIVGILYYVWRPTTGPLTLYGNVDQRQVSLSFNASERIASMNVEEGARVKKGDVLAQLATEPLQLSIAQTKAQIAQQEAIVTKLHNGSRPEEINEAAATVSNATATAENARVTYERLRQLRESGAISQQELDNAEARYNEAVANVNRTEASHQLAVAGPRSEDIAAAEAQLAALKEQLKMAEYKLSQATLVAPENGTIRNRLMQPGDMAAPNKPVYLLSLDTTKWVRAYVNEKDLGRIYEGMPATVTIDSLSGQTLSGTVGFISGTAEFTPKQVQTTELRTDLVYEVRINVEDPNNVLRLGMPATVTFDNK